MRSRMGLAGRGAAVLGASAMALTLSALPASADSAVTGEIDNGAGVRGYQINLGSGYFPVTELFKLDLDTGKSVWAYCVEVHVGLDRDRTMVEKPWDAYPNPKTEFDENRAKINWVLHHGYPAVEVNELEKAVPGSHQLNKQEAITATQAAVWHYSDGEQVMWNNNPLPHNQKHVDDVKAVYDYLTGKKNTGIEKQPKASLKIDPESAEGVAGERIGPIEFVSSGEITSNFDKSAFPEGTKFVNEKGATLSEKEILNGAKFFVKIPADAEAGKVSYTLSTTTKVNVGRLFIAKNYDKDPAQSLIVAASEKSTLHAEGTISWSAAPVTTTTPETTTPATTPSESTSATPSSSTTTGAAAPSTSENHSVAPKAETDKLAYTGASVLLPALVGLGLIGAGALTLILVRRRKQAS